MDQKENNLNHDANIDSHKKSDADIDAENNPSLENTLKETESLLKNSAPLRILLDTFEQQNIQFDDFGDVIIGDRLSKPEFPS